MRLSQEEKGLQEVGHLKWIPQSIQYSAVGFLETVQFYRCRKCRRN